MKWVHTLIDYDNVKQNNERGSADVSINLSLLIPSLSNRVSALLPDSQEIWCRLYGGWITLDSQRTLQGTWMLSEISKFRGRIGPLRSKISMSTEISARSDLTLIGTYRDGGQKMVDGMMSVDLISLSDDHDTSLVIVSDDDDLVPSIIASSVKRPSNNPVFVLRRQKKPGSGPNDRLLSQCNVVIAEF